MQSHYAKKELEVEGRVEEHLIGGMWAEIAI